MQLDDNQEQLLKTWVVKKLEDISDEDSDVLADYVLALVKGDDNPTSLRKNCLDNLGDFLQDKTPKFVDELVTAVQTKSYDPSQKAITSQAPNGPRKRGFGDVDDGNSQSGPSSYTNGNRPVKQMRRGGRAGHDRQSGQQWQAPFQQGSMPMNPQDAFQALLAMQQAMGLPMLPGMEQFAAQAGVRKSGRRCRDYDNKGFCARGAACQYEHGPEAVITGQIEQYDPTQAMLLPEPDRSGRVDTTRGHSNGRKRGRGRDQGRAGGRRSEFSLPGPSQDRSLTALVVEQIPEDKFDELQVRDFFNQFGNIQKVDMQPYKRLAIITFDSWEEANAAYTSPKVIFDNRFVKVFWYQPASNIGSANHNGHHSRPDTAMSIDKPEIDHEEIAKRQEEAQRRHDEAKRARDEAQQQKESIDAKLKAMEEERKKYADLLAKKSAATTASNGPGNDTPQESEQTKGLKAQLAKLEAEAKSLGIDPDVPAYDWQSAPSWRGRGGYRGRGRFPTRANFRGAWAGATARGGAVKRLDNRPRTLSVVFTDGNYDRFEEAIRQYLLFSDNLEHATLDRHPDRADAAMISFEERYRAENFMAAVKAPTGIPNVGSVEVSWMPNAVKLSASTNESLDMMVEDLPAQVSETVTEADADYDVAEDDTWV